MINHFDPFRNRLARDIRNSLARSFLDAVEKKKSSIFEARCNKFLEQSLEQVYIAYIQHRLQQYDKVFSCIVNQDLTDPLEQAAQLWKQGLYFEMHELLEKSWKKASGDRRQALQGLIRAAGMKIHAESGNDAAAASIAAKARWQLSNYGNELADFKGLGTIMDEINRILPSFQDD